MENINEIDFEIIKEFINLPLDSLNQYMETLLEHGGNVSLSSIEIAEAVNSGVQDGEIGIDVECTGGINGHAIYFFPYSECEKLMMLKNRNEYNSVSDDDKYEYVVDGVRGFISDISVNLTNSYRSLIECDAIVGHVEAFTVPRASDFYAQTFEDDEQVICVNGVIKCMSDQQAEFKMLISSELAKSVVDIFLNSDIKLPNQSAVTDENISEKSKKNTMDAFSEGSSNMSGFINDELTVAMEEDNSSFSSDITPILNHKEMPISEKVEHITVPKNTGNLDLIMSVPVEVSVEVGRTKKRIKEILDFKKGTLVELDRVAGEPMDIYVNGKCIAKGEVVVIEDKFGVRITKIMKTNNIFD